MPLEQVVYVVVISVVGIVALVALWRMWLEDRGSGRASVPATKAPAPSRAVEVYSYAASSEDHAAAMLAHHAAEMEAAGYEPTTRSWSVGHPAGAHVVAIGARDPSAMLVAGYLTVTFRRRSTLA